jgi:hypothetical protein
MATNLRICWHAVVSTHSNDCSSRPMLQHLSKPASDLAGSAAAPVQMPLPPTLAPSQATAVSASQAANGQADAPEAGNRDSDASAPTPGLQTPPKNGKRRRGGRVSHCYSLCIFMCSTDVSNLIAWSLKPGLTVPIHHHALQHLNDMCRAWRCRCFHHQRALTVRSTEWEVYICSTDSADVPNSHGNAYKSSATLAGYKIRCCSSQPADKGQRQGCQCRSTQQCRPCAASTAV